MPRAQTKAQIDREFRAKVDALFERAVGPGRPVSTGRSRAAGGKRINLSLGADEYRDVVEAAKAHGVTPGKYVLGVAVHEARQYLAQHRRAK